MKKINIQRAYYQFRHKYLTTNNIVVAVGLVIAAGFIFSSLDAMERNYTLQKELDDKSRELIVAQLDEASAELEQRYYKTDEYKELAVRQRLGLGSAGESVLILSDDSTTKTSDNSTSTTAVATEQKGNFWQWVDFLSGKNIKNISK
jgi:hypothetical protein